MQRDAIISTPTPLPRWQTPALALAIVALTLALFWPAVHHEFLTYDDHDYVVGNPAVQEGPRWSTIQWAFTTGHASNWHPLTWLSHALDCRLFGLNPWGHHFTNILLHAVNAALLFLLLKNWTGAMWRSAFVAAVFAWHPLRVESVAWVAERKDVLSGFFFFLTLMAYGKYVRGAGCEVSGSESPKSKVGYVMALVFFALGLMSKPTLVTVPFLLLLLDAWPLGRWIPFERGWLRAVAGLLPEKIPFLLLSAASCVATYSFQKAGNAIRDFSLEDRLANVPVAYARYLGKLFYPTDLAVIYPYHPMDFLSAAAAVLLLAGLSYLAIRLAGKHRYGFVGWFWFLGMLVPMIGLVQVGYQAMADRYTYLPAIGLACIAAWSAPEICRRLYWPVAICTAVALCIFAALIPVTRNYLALWNNSIDLFRHAVSVTTLHTLALKNMGLGYMEKGRSSEAQSCFEQALQIDPDDQPSVFNLGSVLLQQGKVDEAVIHLRQAVDTAPRAAVSVAYVQVAMMLAETNQSELAIRFYRGALTTDPDQVTALNNLAWLLATSPQDSLRDGNDAIQLATRACRLTNYRIPVMLGTLAAAHAETGNFSEAISTAELARDKARAAKLDELVKRNDELIALYRTGKPFREGK